MVSREGEEAECHETDSNLSTPPRMGSMKISSRDPLQNRLSIESCQKLGRRRGEIRGSDYDQDINENSENNNELRKDTGEQQTVKINISLDKAKNGWNKDGQSTGELENRVPPIPQIEEGTVELRDLENDTSTSKVHQENPDVWNVPNESQDSNASKAKSRRNCWVSNDHSPIAEISSATSVRTPKKVNFRSVEEELKPEIVANRFSNGNYKGAKGFDVDPPPSYIDYNDTSQNNGSDKGKEREKRKWNMISTDDMSEKESEYEDEKKVEMKSVTFLSLFRFASWHDKLLIFIGIAGAIIGGVSLPFMIVLFGRLANTFVSNDVDPTQICDAKYFPQCCANNGTLFMAEEPSCQYVLSNITGKKEDSETKFLDSISSFSMGTAIIGFNVFLMSYIFVTCLNHAAENQAFKIRQVFLTSVLRQNIAWYDTHQTNDFAAKMAEDLNKFQEGIGEKIGMCVFFLTIFSANIVNAFVHGWQLTFVMIAPMPLLVASMSVIAKSQTLLTEKEFAAYGRAGAIAEEVLSSIRTVVAFGGQKKEVERFERKLTFARRAGIMRGVLVAIGGAIMWFIIYASYALAFWYGVKLIMDDRESCLISLKECFEENISNGSFNDGQNCQPCPSGFDPASLMVVFFSVLMGAMNIGQASPYVEAFAVARAAAAAIFTVIDRIPEIDSFSDEGAKPNDKSTSKISKNNNLSSDEEKQYNNNSHIKDQGNRARSGEWVNSGNIVFDNVKFNYPSRHEVQILKGLNLTINKGETVALVGPSGCGKSTVIQLVQRFYDPESGSIQLGGKDIKEVNLRWLRERIGIVGQEPVLFGCTIGENIKQGRKGVTQEEMEKACIEANAYNFIKKLPKKFDTLVGERGAQLSGGQKQRIAIARALVRNPDILLLDEATSALDSQSEAVVQVALDKARFGRTTIVVAHRLSTIRTADKIVAIKDGQVVETGSHEELMNGKGLYYSLVLAQTDQEFESLDDTEYPDIIPSRKTSKESHFSHSGEGAFENFENLDEVFDLSLPPPSSMISTTSSVLAAPAVSSQIMVNNYVTGASGQGSSITQIGKSRRKSRPGLDRKISVSSIMSEDSYQYDSTIMQEASRSLGSAIGFSRVGSTGGESRRRSTLNVPRRQSVVSRRSSVGIDDRHLSTVTTSNNVDEILKAEDLPKINTLRIFKTNGKEWHYILMGSLASVVMGASMPVYAYLFGEVLGLLAGSVENARNGSYFYSLMFLLLGVAVAIGFFFQITMYATAGEHLTQRMRKLTFEAMLRQEMGWFDDPANSTGALCSRLSADAGALQGATGARGGAIVQAIFTIVLAISAGIYHEWKLGLVGALFVPVVLVGSTAQAKIIASQDNLEKDALETSAKLAIEAITNIRTVAGLGREKTFVQRYVGALKGPHQEAMKKSHLRGLVFGFAQSTPFFAYAGCMYYGGYLVETDGLPFKKCFQVAEALILGTMMVGQASAFQPNYNKAVIAAGRIFKLLDRKPLIDSNTGPDSSGLRLDTVDGDISFKNAVFQYPTRPEVNVLRELDLALTHGQKVAIVGPSGCGKSTCIQLLQRYYDLKNGDACVDNHNINSLNVPWLRSTMGIVSQEPVLFDRTLAENIQYGDNEREVSMDEVVDAARRANIHSFIASLPQGYQTRVGEKGAQLSGGQKQRVAIARALVRNPTILLLDEATSALDSESEKVVQDALDAAQEGRTSITIAHRLSTIIHSDVIFVISHGRVVEKGTHSQLLTLNGLYHKLWSTQTGVLLNRSGSNKSIKRPSIKVTNAQDS